MKISKGIQTKMNECWDSFRKTMLDSGYTLLDNGLGDDVCTSLPIGTSCCKNDKYVPIINFQMYPFEKKLWIEVKDRNGNAIACGNVVGIYFVDCLKPYFEHAFDDMVQYVLNKYSTYNKSNRLDFDVDEQNSEKISFN